jgi:hypothetical protein
VPASAGHQLAGVSRLWAGLPRSLLPELTSRGGPDGEGPAPFTSPSTRGGGAGQASSGGDGVALTAGMAALQQLGAHSLSRLKDAPWHGAAEPGGGEAAGRASGDGRAGGAGRSGPGVGPLAGLLGAPQQAAQQLCINWRVPKAQAPSQKCPHAGYFLRQRVGPAGGAACVDAVSMADCQRFVDA